MAEEVMAEDRFPCPCGKGNLVVEIREHDVWSSGRHLRRRLDCGECSERYRLRVIGAIESREVIVARSDYDEIERRERVLWAKRNSIQDDSANKYFERWFGHLSSLQSKAAVFREMQGLLGAERTLSTFYRKTKGIDGLKSHAEDLFRWNIESILEKLGVQDVALAKALSELRDEEKLVKEFERSVPAIPVPKSSLEDMV
jgi:hypothetical protein